MFLFILYVLFLLGSELQLLIWIMKSEGWVNTLFPAVSYIYIYTYIYYASCCNKCKGPVSSVSFPITFLLWTWKISSFHVYAKYFWTGNWWQSAREICASLMRKTVIFFLFIFIINFNDHIYISSTCWSILYLITIWFYHIIHFLHANFHCERFRLFSSS